MRDAWAVGQSRPRDVNRLLPMLRACLLASDTMEAADAVTWIERWLRWFEQHASVAVSGVSASPASVGATLERLYFDGPGTEDWTALARVGDSFVPALGPNHIFMPH